MLPLRERGFGGLITFFVTVGTFLYYLPKWDDFYSMVGGLIMTAFAAGISSTIFGLLKIR
jgi:hypothetical protein